ncbi:hypothetical protein BK022_02810 [Methylorubrum extorquens]|uniref:Uncharacterized protein n=1 Tax=Methylorubrum extorquens TaxID=408 RepID=A0A1S1PA61_METEX|nr:hypothetical protein BK022_02810 [Methylorubrum extorquens]
MERRAGSRLTLRATDLYAAQILPRLQIIRGRVLSKGAIMSLHIASAAGALIVTALGLSLLTCAAHMPEQMSPLPPAAISAHLAG